MKSHKNVSLIGIIITLFCLQSPTVLFGTETEPLLGILFFKPNCLECRELFENAIPKAFADKKGKGGILAVNNASSSGSSLYLAYLLERNLSPALSPPILITKDGEWSGFEAISDQLTSSLSSLSPISDDKKQLKALLKTAKRSPQHIERHAAVWIDQDIRAVTNSPTEIALANFNKDRAGNGIAVAVLLGMVVSLLGIIFHFLKGSISDEMKLSWLYPLLCCLAFGIASYLFSFGLLESELSCGPVGECNTVQQSAYSRIWGLIPISLLGMLSYLAGVGLWGLSRWGSFGVRNTAVLLAWGNSVLGVIFFIYLTFLEPFVIGATCLWCITSAVLTTIAALIATRPAKRALKNLRSASVDN